MSKQNVKHLAVLVREHKEELLARWRSQLSGLPGADRLDRPTLDDHIPDLLEEIAIALASRSEESIVESHLAASPTAHGIQRLQVGFDITEVVAEYNVLRGCLHDLAHEYGLALQGEAFHIVNRVLDDGIASAVQAYASERALEVQKRREEHLAFVAHDLRTPLHAISLAASMLEDELGHDASNDANEALKTLQRNLRRLDTLVVQVVREQQNLAEEAGVRLERREIELWPLVERLVRDLRPLYQGVGARVVNVIPRDLTAFADADLLVRIFQNLLANAIEYTPGGDITISAEKEDDGWVECRVVDTGAGIPPTMLPRIFDKLETDPQRVGGLGLGLAIVRDYVELHGGTVRAESEIGIGTTFRVRLPEAGTSIAAAKKDG